MCGLQYNPHVLCDLCLFPASGAELLAQEGWVGLVQCEASQTLTERILIARSGSSFSPHVWQLPLLRAYASSER